MKIGYGRALICATLVLLTGCGKKADVQSRIAELEAAFPSEAAAPAPAAAETAVQPQAAAPAALPEVPAGANDLVKAAVAAARSDDYAGGVIALQAVQQQPGVTADQVMAVQRTKQAMIAALQQRAANGDRAALAQLKAIEKTRSQ
jgi:hypothetical protein